MKRHGNLFPQIASPGNIYLAYLKARRGKRNFPAVKRFARNEEANLQRIYDSLANKTFHTHSYNEKVVFEPKKRMIYVLPFDPDRIVQHALMNVVAPIWERLYIVDSYACIEGRGIHAGSRRTMEYVRRNTFCLKCDVASFYMSVDHDILMEIIKHKIKCKDTLWLIEDILINIP